MTAPAQDPSPDALAAAIEVSKQFIGRHACLMGIEAERIFAIALDAFVAAERARVDGILQYYLNGFTDPDPESDYTKHDLVSDLIKEMVP